MKQQPSHDKLRGGYYTPQAISNYLTNWAIRDKNESVLEPSCGDGNILIEAANRLHALNSESSLIGVELLPKEAARAIARLKEANTFQATVIASSFFDFAEKAISEGDRYDVVVGNPPFVRYQDFPEDQRQKSFGLMRHMGLNPSRLSNAWLPFLAISAGLLTERGRLALVIPAELFQVGYAAEVRKYLAEHFRQINIVAFKRLVFPDIQQEIVLLLADKCPSKSRGIRVHEVEDAGTLSEVDIARLSRQPIKPVDHASEKWTKYFLDKAEILLLREMRERTDIPQLNSFIDIDVGVVTGANDYFLLSSEERRERKLEDSTIPIVGRSAALAGIDFSEEDFATWDRLGKKVHMFSPTPPYSAAAKRYIKFGEAEGIDGGYKCRIRKEWFVVPSVWTPDFFFLRQADSSPRLVANSTGALCTDTLHRGRLLNGVRKDLLAAAFNNSLTFAASEVMGRSYGGGVMTFEPSEVERLPLPVQGMDAVDVRAIDKLIRKKDVASALDLVDRATLIDALGFSESQVTALRGVWMKLRDRRRGRKK